MPAVISSIVCLGRLKQAENSVRACFPVFVKIKRRLRFRAAAFIAGAVPMAINWAQRFRQPWLMKNGSVCFALNKLST